MKLFTKIKHYTRPDGVIVTKFKPNADITIQSINLETGDVSDKKILEYSKHENLVMYKVEHSNAFDTFWVSEDHSLIVYDLQTFTYQKISPTDILKEPDRYTLIKGSNRQQVSCEEVSLTIDPSKTIGYDFTVADNYTFATYDGIFVQDTVSVHLPISRQALYDVKQLMDGTKHLLNPANGKVVTLPSHEILIGLYQITNIVEFKTVRKFQNIRSMEYLNQIDELKVNEKILFKKNGVYEETCLGRLWVENLLGIHIDKPMEKKSIQVFLSKSYDTIPRLDFVKALDELKELGFEWASRMNFSLSMKDFYIPSTRDAKFDEAKIYAQSIEGNSKLGDDQKHELIVRNWMETIKSVQSDFLREAGLGNSLVLILKTGARASMSQISQLVVAKGMLADSYGNISRKPIDRNHKEGLTPFGYFRSVSGSRKGLTDAKFATPRTGYLTRRLVMAARDFYITEKDCKTKNGLWVPNDRAKGRKVIETKEGWSKVRSPIFCEGKGGICKQCYGIDPATRRRVVKNTAVGVIAGQSLSEPTTQMTLRTFHTCLHPHTTILDVNNKRITIQEVYDRIKSGEEIYTFSCSSKGKVQVSKIMDCHKNRKERYVTKITLDHGESFICTNDHKIMMRDGTYKEAATLYEGASLMPIYIMEKKGERRYVKESVYFSDAVNHKVLSVESIDLGFEEYMFDLTVDSKFENYPLGAGVFIHNSGAAELGDSPKVITSDIGGTVSIKVMGKLVQINVDDHIYYVHDIASILVKNKSKIQKGTPIASYLNIVRQEDVTNKVPILELYFEIRKPKVQAVIATTSGRVEVVPSVDEDALDILIDGNLQGSVINQPIFVRNNELVRKGQFLSYGEANLKQLFKETGDFELISQIFVERLLDLYTDEGVDLNQIHIEVIFRALTETVLKDDGTVGLRMFEKGNVLLRGANQMVGNHPSWLKAAAFGWTKFNLSNAAALNKISYDLPTERIITGELLPRRSADFA